MVSSDIVSHDLQNETNSSSEDSGLFSFCNLVFGTALAIATASVPVPCQQTFPIPNPLD